MYSNFKEQAIEFVKQAVQKRRCRQWPMVGRNRQYRRSRSSPSSDLPSLQHSSSPFFCSHRRCSWKTMFFRQMR
ncbi:hypothetical protein HanRHA438_Chr15g0720871 [Helianthus annuus]|nr:hypothetical protein HanRHA438_Chr15g0720871 [Helianthus annuus]